MVIYINFNLIILAMLVMMAVILILVRLPDRAAKTEQRKAELDRKLAKVPTPWGWPHYESISVGGIHLIAANGHSYSFSESFYHWADRLVQEKHTVDNVEYMHKREGCIRALLEDRYGWSGRMETMTEAKVTPPLSGVPVASHDQMDNFSSGRVNKIEARFLRKRQVGAISPYMHQLKLGKLTGLQDLKLPWGW